MITARTLDGGSLPQSVVDAAEAASLIESQPGFLWLDVGDPTDDELDSLLPSIAMHPLVEEDVRHRGQRPKLEVIGESGFVAVRSLALSTREELEDGEIHLVVGPDRLVSFRFATQIDPRAVVHRTEGRDELLSYPGPFLLYAILDEVVDGFLEVADRLEEAADAIEDQVFDRRARSGELEERIFRLKRDVVEFRRLAGPMRRVVDSLQEHQALAPASLVPFFRDLGDHVLRAVEFADNVRDVLTSMLEARLSQTANRLGAWGALILVPTLIAGIYGMNFRHIPELGWQLGYPGALVVMAVSAGVLYWWFRRKGFL